MNSQIKTAIDEFIVKEKLPLAYANTVEQWFLPLAERLLQKVSVANQALVVGISGCQGSGKSTLADLLVLLLKELMGLKAINVSIDDFYLSRSERLHLADTIHPLFATRGVPGTHNMPLAMSTISNLRSSGPVAIPRFNKAIDDCVISSEWPVVQAPVDVIILEGWCLNIPPQSSEALLSPINELEQREDGNGDWRSYVNSMISQSYQSFYDLVDYLIMLKAPDFDKVFAWRSQQEDKLAALAKDNSQNKVMDHEQLQRFIQHYERLTRHGLDVLPDLADCVFQLTDQHTIDKKIKG